MCIIGMQSLILLSKRCTLLLLMMIIVTTPVFLGSVAFTTGFTNGASQIWLDNVDCNGTETRLIDCPANELGVHNCGHNEDAGVKCLLCK